MSSNGGPLDGIVVVEVAGIGPGPFAGMMLADMGATVIRVDRVDSESVFRARPAADVLARGRQSIAIDLKSSEGVAVLLRIVEQADAMFEGFRPGVAERLGFGPETCLLRNPRLVYGRMTGYGQHGPLAQAAGHDINYISVAGALHPMGRAGEPPTPPLNLVGDFGGGGMLLAFGIVCALLEAQRSGIGQVIDAAMIDGVSSLMAMIWGARAGGIWEDSRESNSLDGGAPYYRVYETGDGQFMSVGAMEPKFFASLVERLGLTDAAGFQDQHDRRSWPKARERLESIFRERTRDEWCAFVATDDICVTPVLSMDEVITHDHHTTRGTFVEVDGVVQGNVAPRLSRTPGTVGQVPSLIGEHTEMIMRQCGFERDELEILRQKRIVA